MYINEIRRAIEFTKLIRKYRIMLCHDFTTKYYRQARGFVLRFVLVCRVLSNSLASLFGNWFCRWKTQVARPFYTYTVSFDDSTSDARCCHRTVQTYFCSARQ